MIGVPSSPSIAIAASVLALVVNDYISSSNHFCLAFQHSTHLRPSISRYFYNSKPPSRTEMEMAAGEYCDGSSNSLTPIDIDSSLSFQSLQNFVDILSRDSDSTSICQLISSDTEDRILDAEGRNATITEINTIIFRPIAEESLDAKTTDKTYAVAIVPSSDKVDVRFLSEELSKLQERNDNGSTGGSKNHYDRWELAPSCIVKDLCGFEPGTIPPLLVSPRKDGAGCHDAEGIQRPFATIIDSSLLWRSINSTVSKVNGSKDVTKQLLLGGGGSVDYRCLIDLEFLVKSVFEIENTDSSQSDTRNAKIASIIRFDGGINFNGASKRVSSSSSSTVKSTNRDVDSNNSIDYPSEKKPFFQIAPPPNSIIPEGSRKPHRPVPVTAIGRLTSVRQIAKKLVFADFAPPDYDYNEWLVSKNASAQLEKYYDKTENGMWRSGEDGKEMYVQIIVGKTFCERYEDGTARLKDLKPGKLVLVRGAANVGK